MDEFASSSEGTTVEVSKLNEENRNDNNGEHKKFVLPPEYDENDSRWTLKYRESAPGLVELITHSGVYVNASSLAECQEWSNDCKTFARMLLSEIFLPSALSTCVWAGTNAKTTDIDSPQQARPGLDKNARDVMLNFVVEYGQIRDWARTDYQCIMKGIRQVMLEMRLAQHKKEKKIESDNEHGSEENICKEYDKNDSRWTLKYREYAPGLVELIEDSCVYVRATQPAICKRLSKDYVTLARMLFAEVFNTAALSTCSLPGAYAKKANHDGIHTRPELDENAVMTLLKYVKQFQIDSDWFVTNEEIRESEANILNSIQQKLEVLRLVNRKDNNQDDAPSSPKRKIRMIDDIPPEYDENDSRWTLKYREPAPGLVELMEHSDVYVNAEKLAECKSLSDDCLTLARKLLTETFTSSALGTCALPKRNRIIYRKPLRIYQDVMFDQRKPELDAHAEVILLNFVDECGLGKGWPILDFESVRKSMSYVMNEVRRKRTECESARRRAAREKIDPVC